MVKKAAVILFTLRIVGQVSEQASDFIARFEGGIGVIPPCSVPLEPNGDFRIDDTLTSVPSECPGPLVLIRDPGGAWFSGPKVSFMRLAVNIDPLVLWPATGARPAAGLAMRSDRALQAPTSTRSKARARSTTRTIIGAIVGGVGGFFAGGFLGAHIEGDRCNCDDPGVRGFLIGAPIGAVAGGIVGAKFLF